MHRKGAQDARRAKKFARLIKELQVAARSSTDPESNPRLRTALSACKSANMPKDNIQRVLNKANSGEQDNLIMPDANIGEKLVMDYGATGLSLRAHPVALLAPYFGQDGWQGCAVAAAALQGKRLSLIGLVTTRQRPGTAKGTVFVTMEDGDFSLNVIIWPKLVETYRQAVLKSRLLGVVGRIQREGRVLHFIAERLEVCDDYLRHLRTASGAVLKPYKGRNFH